VFGEKRDIQGNTEGHEGVGQAKESVSAVGTCEKGKASRGGGAGRTHSGQPVLEGRRGGCHKRGEVGVATTPLVEHSGPKNSGKWDDLAI